MPASVFQLGPSTLRYWADRLVAVGTLASLGLMTWWLFEPFPLTRSGPAVFLTSEGTPAEQIVAGTWVVVRREACAREALLGKRSMRFESALVYQLPATDFALPEGCATIQHVLRVPYYMPSGRYRFVEEVEVRVNVLRTEVKRFPGVEVDVTAMSRQRPGSRGAGED
jgi:hypothetical protein